MTLLQRIEECRRHDPSRYLPWRVDGHEAGAVRRDFAAALAEHPDIFDVTAEAVTLRASLDDFASRSAALAEVVDALMARGLVPDWGSELYPVAPEHGAPPWLELERSALPVFGARAYGVHMHGLVRREDGLHLWVARRARDKPTFPGQLDHLVAGGQPIGISVRENLAKECAEEADIPPALAARAVATGQVRYRLDIERGLRNDTLFLFELELPEDFVPRNTDGEVESFELWPAARVLETVANTRDFKFNCNLALIDFFVRHGLVGPEDGGHTRLVDALHRSG